MKTALSLLPALLLVPLAAFAQAKPEVANAAKASRRAWESAPAEKKALWQQQRDALKHIDLSEDTQRQIIIARGTTEASAYHAHPTTAMLADNKTIFCVWNIGHGGHAGPMARSDDGGLTWKRVDELMPPNYVNFKGGIIFRLTDSHGKDRLWVFSGKTAVGKDEVIRDFPGRLQGYVPRIVSEDDGKTWRELPPLGAGRLAKDEPFRCVFAFWTIVPLKDGSHLGMFHRATGAGKDVTLQVVQSITHDGGFTRFTEMIQNIDYAPTFMEMAGGQAPASVHGRSIVPVLKGETPSDWRKSIYYHWFSTGGHMVPIHYGVRTQRHTLAYFTATDEWELFDLEKDPQQMRSVHADPAYAATVAELKTELTRLRTHYGDTEDPKRGKGKKGKSAKGAAEPNVEAK